MSLAVRIASEFHQDVASNEGALIGVSMMPGATALTVMPRLATSCASDLVAELSAPLAAE